MFLLLMKIIEKSGDTVKAEPEQSPLEGNMEFYYPLILDGATGTALQKRGFSGGCAAESWVLEHPETILEIQRGYVAAGSQVLYAPTFGGNRVKLRQHGVTEVEETNRRLAALAKEAAGGKALVAGDLAPTGEFLYPLGGVRFEQFVEIYAQQARALEEAGVDLFVIETQMTLAEARAAVLAVREVSRKPVFVTVTCDEKGKMITGTDVTAALVVLQGMGVDAFGLNCSAGPEEMLRQLRRLTPYAEIPLIAKPNAGMPQVVNGETVYGCSPEAFAAHVEEMAEAGVQIFGGCCGTTAEHIAALSAAVKNVTLRAIAPAYSDLLPLATEKQPCCCAPDAAYGAVLSCGDGLEDAVMDELEEDGELIAILIESEGDLVSFEECQYLLRKPLCLLAEDAVLLEKALRLYQGRALYEGGLSDEALLPLVRKYGLVI